MYFVPIPVILSGVFVSKQKGDTDMGSKVPKDILVKGKRLRLYFMLVHCQVMKQKYSLLTLVYTVLYFVPLECQS